MNGREHLIGNLATAGIGMAYVASSLPEAIPGAALGFALGVIAGPDVRDQEHKRNIGEHVVDWVAGQFIGRLWTMFWWPLAKAIPHRSKWSHRPLVGTAIGMVYLFGPMVFCLWLWHGHVGGFADYARSWITQPWMFYCFACWCLQDCIHWIQDRI